jgi:hypothetical protein
MDCAPGLRSALPSRWVAARRSRIAAGRAAHLMVLRSDLLRPGLRGFRQRQGMRSQGARSARARVATAFTMGVPMSMLATGRSRAWAGAQRDQSGLVAAAGAGRAGGRRRQQMSDGGNRSVALISGAGQGAGRAARREWGRRATHCQSAVGDWPRAPVREQCATAQSRAI